MTGRVVFLAVLACLTVAKAAESPALDLARICEIEARSDCPHIYWIGVKRADIRGGTWLHQLKRHSVPWKRPTTRSRDIKKWPDGDVPNLTPRQNRRWSELRDTARRLVSGEVPDPCPAALSWNGPHMPVRGRQWRVCEDLQTANWLYRDRP